MKRKKFLSFIILIILVGMSFGQFIPNLFTFVYGAEPIEDSETFFESFETVVPQTGWDFAHSSFFSRDASSYHMGDDPYSLKVTPNTNGRYFEGAQFAHTFADGSIEGWVYPSRSGILYSSLWIRTTDVDPSDNYCSFNSGFALYPYSTGIYLRAYIEGTWSPELDSISAGEYVANTWWHLKLEADGTLLKAWFSTDETFSSNPDLEYDTEGTNFELAEGKAGISARTNTHSGYNTYFDSITIDYEVDTWHEGFETDIPQDYWVYAHEEQHSTYEDNLWTDYVKEGDYCLVSSGPGGKVYDGVLFDELLTDGSIEGWFNPVFSQHLATCLWIRTSNLKPEEDPTFDWGYLLMIYTDKAYLKRYVDGTWETLGDPYELGCPSNNHYWHLKLRVVGTLLQAWVTQGEILSQKPQLSYDTKNDPIKLAYGRAAFSTRCSYSSSYYKTYVDAITIKITTPHSDVIYGNEDFGNGFFSNPIKNAKFDDWYGRDLLGDWTTNAYYDKSFAYFDEEFSVKAFGQPNENFYLSQVIDHPSRLAPFLGHQILFGFSFKRNDIEVSASEVKGDVARAEIRYKNSGDIWTLWTNGDWIIPPEVDDENTWYRSIVSLTVPVNILAIEVRICGMDTRESNDGFNTLIDSCTFGIYYFDVGGFADMYESGECFFGFEIHSLYKDVVSDWKYLDMSITFGSEIEWIFDDGYGLAGQLMKFQYSKLSGYSSETANIHIKEYGQANEYEIPCADSLSTWVDASKILNVAIKGMSFLLSILGVTTGAPGIATTVIKMITTQLLGGFAETSDFVRDSVDNDDLAYCEFELAGGYWPMAHTMLTVARATIEFDRHHTNPDEYLFEFNNEVWAWAQNAPFNIGLKLQKIGTNWNIIPIFY